MLLLCTLLCNYISYQVDMLRERSTDQLTVSHVASSLHDFCANNGTSPVTCLMWRESWLCAQNCENNIILSYYFTFLPLFKQFTVKIILFSQQTVK